MYSVCKEVRKGCGYYLSSDYVPCVGSEISFPGLGTICFGWYSEDGLLKPEICRAPITIKIVLMHLVGLYITYIKEPFS
jgi:hypothetical protein